MRSKDIKGLSRDKLNELLSEKREALRKFRFSISSGSGKSKNTKEGCNIKKDIARTRTFLRIKDKNAKGT